MTSPPPPSRDQLSREALLAAKQAVMQDEVRKREAAATVVPPRPRAAFQLIMGAVAVVLAALLVVRPAWLFPPEPVETPAIQDASLRVRMYMEIQRVERYRQAAGKLPATLVDAGGDTTGLSYAQDGTGFSLTGSNAGRSLTYRSTTPATEFLGRSYDIIRARSRR